MKILMIAVTAILLTGCQAAYYPPAYTVAQASPSKFDRSWSAVNGAFADQGVKITYQDYNTGVIQGTANGVNVSASLSRQANGSVRVQFNKTGNSQQAPMMMQGITNSYNRRMGR
ncbi:MAG: hypothetical protein GQ582_04845 [Methyloprofundus sp.]|nr:hypothetical protein [Methyloprofundus sp.]